MILIWQKVCSLYTAVNHHRASKLGRKFLKRREIYWIGIVILHLCMIGKVYWMKFNATLTCLAETT